MKMKLDIENKILIPFMLLAILPITILGIVSYWNGYQLLLHDREQSQKALLKEAIVFMELVDAEVHSGSVALKQAKAETLGYFQRMERPNMAVIEDGRLILGDPKRFPDEIVAKVLANDGRAFDIRNRRFLSNRFEVWDWTIVMTVNKSFFPEELIEIQKYALLLTIIFLVLSMQSIIFIAHHISKPIKYFAEVCRKIELGNMKEKVNINRHDEIGVLANSFNHMIDQLDVSTEKLIEMTKFNEDILKNIDIGIMTTDKDGHLMTMNRSGKEILARYEDAPVMEELESLISRTIRDRLNLKNVLHFSSPGGKTVYLDAGTSLLIKEDGSFYGAICSFNDISERKILENNLVRVDRLASVGQFAAGLAHEIRNPLTGIKTGIQVIKNREISRNETANAELMEGLTYEIDRINSLITDLLDFSKPKQTVREKGDICELIRKSLEMAKDGIVRKKISVRFNEADNPVYVFADKGQAEQIFLNIITNAVEALDEYGVLAVSTDRISEDSFPWIRILFADNGSGIGQEHLDRIFDPFFTTKAKGTGLGLVVVAKLIEENNGKISIRSKIDQGTNIAVLLPEFLEGEN